MPATRAFTESELQIARDMRAARKGWGTIGRELGCSETTIRAAVDPDFDNAGRLQRIQDRKREHNQAAAVKRAAKEAKAATAYDASGMDFL